MALAGNLIIGQSGGPTSVINGTLSGVIQEAKKHSEINGVFGMRFGIKGFMDSNIIDLGQETDETIEGLRHTPSSILGSSRHKLTDKDLPKILEVIKENNIRYFFMIGGNDTMDTIYKVEKYCKEQGYELSGIGLPKTVDNDLYGTDHTPGFASAARYTALSVMQSSRLFRDMQKVDQYVIYQSIGRDAGWLTASSVLGRTSDAEGPHVLVIPERPLNKEKFLSKVKSVYDSYGFVSIAVGEGATWEDGSAVSASQTKDKFNNIEFGSTGGVSVAMVLHSLIKEAFDWRGEFQISESLPMCACDRVAENDITEAYTCGVKAVRYAMEGKTGVMVSIIRTGKSIYAVEYGESPLSEVAEIAKPMPDEYISEDGFGVTDKFIEYLKPLVGELPKYVSFKNVKVS